MLCVVLVNLGTVLFTCLASDPGLVATVIFFPVGGILLGGSKDETMLNYQYFIIIRPVCKLRGKTW